MDDWIEIEPNPEHVARERNKARTLRNSAWWKNEIARGICHYCQGKFAPADLSMDHVVPVVRGGRSAKGNVVPCCKECNNRKKYLTPAEMLLNEIELSGEVENEEEL